MAHDGFESAKEAEREPGADPAPHTNMGIAMDEIAFLRRELTEAVTARNGLQVGHDRLEREKANLLAALKVVMTAIGTYVPPSSRGQWGDAMEQARAAIEAAS